MPAQVACIWVGRSFLVAQVQYLHPLSLGTCGQLMLSIAFTKRDSSSSVGSIRRGVQEVMNGGTHVSKLAISLCVGGMFASREGSCVARLNVCGPLSRISTQGGDRW